MTDEDLAEYFASLPREEKGRLLSRYGKRLFVAGGFLGLISGFALGVVVIRILEVFQ